jgi:hypothetical protein
MKEKNAGVIVFVPSSGAAPYMGAYEIFKTAQIELCNTLCGELEGTNIFSYTIAPGLVKTDTAQKAIETISPLMEMTVAEFYEMNEKLIMDAEEAGVGFAVSVVNAERYNEQEIGSIQALMDVGIIDGEPENEPSMVSSGDMEAILPHIKNIVCLFKEQHEGWLQRSVFERQWILRDFKKTAGFSADGFFKEMTSLLSIAETGRLEKIIEYIPHLKKLKAFYLRQYELLKGYEKDPETLMNNSQIITGWVDEVQTTIDLLK